jgi:hypothetical protein
MRKESPPAERASCLVPLAREQRPSLPSQRAAATAGTGTIILSWKREWLVLLFRLLASLLVVRVGAALDGAYGGLLLIVHGAHSLHESVDGRRCPRPVRIALLGHSDTHASQLMHSAVIIRAMLAPPEAFLGPARWCQVHQRRVSNQKREAAGARPSAVASVIRISLRRRRWPPQDTTRLASSHCACSSAFSGCLNTKVALVLVGLEVVGSRGAADVTVDAARIHIPLPRRVIGKTVVLVRHPEHPLLHGRL